MRKYLFLLVCLFSVIGCTTDNIELYDSDGYISFVNSEKDTIIVSFFLLGNLQEYDLPVAVRFTGDPYKEKREFGIKVNEKSTTINSQYYTLPEPEMSPMNHLDTIMIHLKNYPELQKTTVSLCVELQESTFFQLGDRNYRKIHIKINDAVAKPDWWNEDVVDFYLGTYSDEKFKELIVVAKPDLSAVNEGAIRNWALQLKYHLEKRANSPEGPVTEADGSLMTVPVNG